MKPNLAKGKTEAMLTLKGKGSLPLRRTLALDQQLLQTTSKIVAAPLHLTGAYKHLGSWLHVHGSPWKEIRVRFATAHGKLTQYKAALFGNRSFPVHKKVQLFDSLVLSALMYNLVIWKPFTKSAQQNFEIKIFGLIRRVAFMHFGIQVKEWSSGEVYATLGVLPPLQQLYIAKLRYLQQLIHTADEPVWAFLQQSPCWWQQMEEAVQWLQHQRRFPFEHGTLLTDWETWYDFIRASASRWKKTIGNAAKHAIKQIQLANAWQKWHIRVVEILSVSGELELPVYTRDTQTPHFCVRCRQAFDTKAAWAVHAFRVHNRVTPARMVATGSDCQVCMKKYTSHVSLIHHLTHSKQCFRELRQRFGNVTRESGLNSRIEQQSRPSLSHPSKTTVHPQEIRELLGFVA